MAPLIPDIIPESLNYLIALIIGVGFGFALEQAGFSSTRKLVGLFYGYDFTVLRVFFTAGVTAMVGVVVMSHLGLINMDFVFVNPTFLSSALIGGVIMGAGFIIGGFCPGTSACAAAVGKIDAWAFLVGAVIGIFLFGEFYPQLEGLYKAQSMGPVLVSDQLGLSRNMFALLMTLVAIGAFIATGAIEDKVNKREIKWIPIHWHKKALVAAAPIVIILAVMASPTRDEYVMAKLEKKVASGECQPNLIDADKLVYELIHNYYLYNVIDVRTPSEFEAFHVPTAINIPITELSKPHYRNTINQYIKTNVFYGSTLGQAKQACLIARFHGNTKSLALSQTAVEFQILYYGSANPSPELLSKEVQTLVKFRFDAAQKLTEIGEKVSKQNQPVPKKAPKVQGGCS
jgi:rhodanese-related sulfurtransferase